MILLHDVSFQLSFMATLSLCLLAPIFEKYFITNSFFAKHSVVREILVTTLSTQIFVAPILLYQMGSVSIVGVLANLFVLPVVPLAMLLVSLVALFAWVPIFATVVAFVAQLFLTYILFIATTGSKISFASVHIESFGIGLLVVSYIVIFFVVYFEKSKKATQ
jgi:competence protein ComEC